ncbi:hypothetical protein GGI02_005335, partial [Coemansia sp. RSA 2322]
MARPSSSVGPPPESTWAAPPPRTISLSKCIISSFSMLKGAQNSSNSNNLYHNSPTLQLPISTLGPANLPWFLVTDHRSTMEKAARQSPLHTTIASTPPTKLAHRIKDICTRRPSTSPRPRPRSTSSSTPSSSITSSSSSSNNSNITMCRRINPGKCNIRMGTRLSSTSISRCSAWPTRAG